MMIMITAPVLRGNHHHHHHHQTDTAAAATLSHICWVGEGYYYLVIAHKILAIGHTERGGIFFIILDVPF
jgi:hypothetical protein